MFLKKITKLSISLFLALSVTVTANVAQAQSGRIDGLKSKIQQKNKANASNSAGSSARRTSATSLCFQADAVNNEVVLLEKCKEAALLGSAISSLKLADYFLRSYGPRGEKKSDILRYYTIYLNNIKSDSGPPYYDFRTIPESTKRAKQVIADISLSYYKGGYDSKAKLPSGVLSINKIQSYYLECCLKDAENMVYDGIIFIPKSYVMPQFDFKPGPWQNGQFRTKENIVKNGKLYLKIYVDSTGTIVGIKSLSESEFPVKLFENIWQSDFRWENLFRVISPALNNRGEPVASYDDYYLNIICTGPTCQVGIGSRFIPVPAQERRSINSDNQQQRERAASKAAAQASAYSNIIGDANRLSERPQSASEKAKVDLKIICGDFTIQEYDGSPPFCSGHGGYLKTVSGAEIAKYERIANDFALGTSKDSSFLAASKNLNINDAKNPTSAEAQKLDP